MMFGIFFKCCYLQRRIFNGFDAKPLQFPYIVSVRGIFYTCGGALLSERYVLTAGHCLMDIDKDEDVTVILGAYNYYNNKESGRLQIRSHNHWVHENFSMPFAENDLGIVELPYAVNFSDQIRPIKLSVDKSIDARISRDDKEIIAVLSGWGYQSADYEPAEILQTARMKLISYEDCIKFQSHFVEKLTRNHICAIGRDNRPGHAVLPCDGDSGSPLILDETQELIGITSYVKDAENGIALHYNDCRTDIAPAVFVRIPAYLNWISEKTGMKFE
ncbi:unnamed protein product [Chironomus riparius]|uniref:Peptidase S1 domain-containing protein n=1 Tax=Chironomus riparius TaxID=315576 RepID=A0A9N9WSG7_9DIPT|nr:unnamed protein product [Chironomus riparius]